jgi:hypothetical protein
VVPEVKIISAGSSGPVSAGYEIRRGTGDHRRIEIDGVRIAAVEMTSFSAVKSVKRSRHLRKPRRFEEKGPGAGQVQPVGDRIRPELHGQRHGDRAELVDRQMRDRRFEALRQQDRDPVAARDAELSARAAASRDERSANSP